MSRTKPTLILVAEDDSGVRSLIREVLEGEGFETLVAEDGQRAVELARERRPALAILDIMMPKMDGYTALTRLRGHPETRDIPVIILTGQNEPLYQDLSGGLGAVAHLTKPFNPEALIETVRRHLPGGGP